MSHAASTRMRLDKALVSRGVFSSRAQAREAIDAGLVRVDGRIVTSAAMQVGADAVIDAERAHQWVSRAGVKLQRGLETLGVPVEGRMCLDIGASTGGFTEVLLAKGARHVVSVDVGRDQLHPGIRADGRVTSYEGLDARQLSNVHLPEPPALVVCDASFIGLEKVLSAPLGLAAKGADLVALFKPQFQVGREHIGKGGIVRDDAPVQETLDQFRAWIESQGWRWREATPSALAGRDGNREWLVWAQKGDATNG